MVNVYLVRLKSRQKVWITATQNASALEKAYRKGYYDALQRQSESEDKE